MKRKKINSQQKIHVQFYRRRNNFNQQIILPETLLSLTLWCYNNYILEHLPNQIKELIIKNHSFEFSLYNLPNSIEKLTITNSKYNSQTGLV